MCEVGDAESEGRLECEGSPILTCGMVSVSLVSPLLEDVMGHSKEYARIQRIYYILQSQRVKSFQQNQPRIGGTYHIPIQQEPIDQNPYDFLSSLLALLLDPREGLSPAFYRILLNGHFYLLVQVIM